MQTRLILLTLAAATLAVSAAGQAASPEPPQGVRTSAPAAQSQANSIALTGMQAGQAQNAQVEMLNLGVSDAVRQLVDFKSSDVKFPLPRLMDILRDKKHEGWVLAAYPDPKTSQPLIGAGFSLDLPAREHPQTDPLNPHPFLEPSSAELWQAAGLDPDRLQAVLSGFHERLGQSDAQQFRHAIPALTPQITDAEAESLLRVGAIQAIYNARAYCRNFDRLTASQQMAMSQLVYQMGFNLQEFSQFLALVNREAIETSRRSSPFWRDVQLSLVQSQWARAYRMRAAAVIAMLDPRYDENPVRAERGISQILRPARVHRGHGASVRNVAYRRTRARRSRLRKN